MLWASKYSRQMRRNDHPQDMRDCGSKWRAWSLLGHGLGLYIGRWTIYTPSNTNCIYGWKTWFRCRGQCSFADRQRLRGAEIHGPIKSGRGDGTRSTGSTVIGLLEKVPLIYWVKLQGGLAQLFTSRPRLEADLRPPASALSAADPAAIGYSPPTP